VYGSNRKSFINLVKDKIQGYPEETAEVAGVETKISSLSQEETERLAMSINSLLYGAPDVIVENVADNFDLVVDLVRAVKSFSRSPYQGIRSKEKGLQIIRLTPDVFTYIWGATGATNWTYEVTIAGVYDYVGTPDSPETTAEEEGLIIFGFLDTSTTKPVKRVQIVKDGRSKFYQDLSFEYLCAYDSVPYIPLEEPILILPESSFYIKVQTSAGTTKLEPVGFKVLMRTEIAKFFE